jgi:hypothetical protein
MINLQNEYKQAVQNQNSAKTQFILELSNTFERIKEAPPDQLNAEEQFLQFLIESPEPVTSVQLDSLIISLHRQPSTADKKSTKLMLAS